MGTEPVQDHSESPDKVDPEIAAIQQSLTADESEPAPEAVAIETALPKGLAEDAPAEGASPAVAGFEAAGPPLKAILPAFVVYDLAWIVYASILVWQLLGMPAGTPAYEWEYYEYALWVGIALTALGPFLILAVWLIARLRHRESNGIGLATLLAGSAATLLGVAVWWGVLIAVDYVRLGSVF